MKKRNCFRVFRSDMSITGLGKIVLKAYSLSKPEDQNLKNDPPTLHHGEAFFLVWFGCLAVLFSLDKAFSL